MFMFGFFSGLSLGVFITGLCYRIVLAGNQSILIKNFVLCLISRKKSNMLVKHSLQRTYPFVSSIHIG